MPGKQHGGIFDEIKNQWGWAGFVTRDLNRCRILARLIALFYNWWNVFTRLAQPDRHLEAVTSRQLLLQAVGRSADVDSVAFRGGRLCFCGDGIR